MQRAPRRGMCGEALCAVPTPPCGTCAQPAHACCLPRRPRSIRPSQQWVRVLLMAAWDAPLAAFTPADLAMLLWGLARCQQAPEPAWMDEYW